MTSPAAHLPLTSFDCLWHVGTLEEADKGRRGRISLEGHGLSVSVHPDDWVAIAQLGGHPVWRLRKTGNRFLDYHTLTRDQRATITRWGLDRGYITLRVLWQVRFDDEEVGGEVAMLCDSYRDACDEADGRWRSDGRPARPGRVLRPVATAAFPDATVAEGDRDPHQVLTVTWVEAVHPDLDGVWWADRYDPGGYSCPRGVITPAQLPTWDISRDR